MKTKFLLLAALALGLFATCAVYGAPQNLVLILDASNSMNKPFGMDTRIAAARSALDGLLTRMPEEGNVGLIAFGHRINYRNEVESCQDIQFLFPLADYTSALGREMIAAVAQVKPQGKTPLADALSLAGNSIGETAQGGVIVLVSDGEGNCGGQEAVVAQMLATMQPPIVLHVIGLDVEAGASEALRAMAEITGGSYWGVTDAAALADALFAAVSTAPVEPVATSQPEAGLIPPGYACFGVTNVIYGTEGDDVIYGTPEGDLIFGLGGNDFIIGLSGNDVLVGGPGRDILEGGDGNDMIVGGEQDDLLFGGAAHDVVCGGPGNDSLEGEAGNDILDGGDGCDTLLGGDGQNSLYCADGADVLFQGTAVFGTYGPCTDGCTLKCPSPEPMPCPAPAVPACPAPAPACPTAIPAQPATCQTPTVAKVLNEGESVQLHGTASDYDCNVLSVLWQASAGTFDNASCLDPVYTAPMLSGCSDQEIVVTLTALDSCGASGSDTFRLLVRNVNHAPTVGAGEDIWIDEGDAILLQAVARDVDGEPLTVLWAAGGPGVFDDAGALTAVYHAPLIDLCDGIDIPLAVTVVDPCGASACDTVVVHVRNVNRAPLVDLGPDFAIDEGQTLRWTPSVNDPDCDGLRYCWTSTAGTFDATNVQNPLFAVPATFKCAGEPIVVTLTVTDPCGLTASDSVTLQVRNQNCAPTVELGSGLCVNEGDAITLLPLVADPDGDVLRYTWTVSAGRLDSTCVATPVFVAPIIKDCTGIDVVVTLTVTDPCGLAATDSAVIRVQNVNQAPVVHADP